MDYAQLDSKIWRPITFEGVTFPPTLMGISVLGMILELVMPVGDAEVTGWLRIFPICCGRKRTAPAEECHTCATRAIDLMLEHRAEVLAGITEYIDEYPFDAESMYRDWIAALQRISELASMVEEECGWSAPGHESDAFGTAEKRKRFLDLLDSDES